MGTMTSPPAVKLGCTQARERRTPAPAVPAADHRVIQARHLDLQADCMLQAGHRAAAEVLSWRAIALRELSR